MSEEVVNDWFERLPDILTEFRPEDIYNCDETGLFFRALPDKTLALKSEDAKGGKLAKERLTVLLCASATGEKEIPLVILKSLDRECSGDKICSRYQ